MLFNRDEKYCAAHFGDAQCDRSCNNRGCLYDGLDCSTLKPQLVSETILKFGIDKFCFQTFEQNWLRKIKGRNVEDLILPKLY